MKWKEGEWIAYSGPNYDDKEKNAAKEVIDSGWLIFGPKCREFEVAFPKFLGKKYGSFVNSGSSANLLMVAATRSKNSKYKLNSGDKVITPVVCFPTTLNPIIQNDLIPVFVDVTLPSMNLDLDQVEEKLKADPGIKAIMFAHVLGNPPDMDRVMSLVEKYNLIFLEDACDALGSTWKMKNGTIRKLGSFGHLSTCSFFPAHHMTTGEGGFVATDDYQTARLISSLRDWGRACYCNTMKPGDVTEGTACGNRFKAWLPGRPDINYDHRYVFDEIGYNLKPMEICGALGLEQIKKLKEMDEARRYNYARYHLIFSIYEHLFYHPEYGQSFQASPCWFGFPLTVRDEAPFTRDQFIQFMEGKKIQTRAYFTGNALDHPAYMHLKTDEKFPVADKVTTSSFFLGTFIGITDEKLDYILKCVDEFMGQVGA